MDCSPKKGVDHCIKIKYANEVNGLTAAEATIASPININKRVKGLNGKYYSFYFPGLKGENSNAISHINAYCNKRIGSSIKPNCIFALNALQAINSSLNAQTTQFDRSAINNTYIYFKMQENESINYF
ncbi:hypothetical protein HK096_005322, partial [Nowakowskiella sp. JEL0078]